MSIKERILTIRLMEKVNANPAYGETLGIVIVNDPVEPERQAAFDSAGKKT